MAAVLTPIPTPEPSVIGGYTTGWHPAVVIAERGRRRCSIVCRVLRERRRYAPDQTHSRAYAIGVRVSSISASQRSMYFRWSSKRGTSFVRVSMAPQLFHTRLAFRCLEGLLHYPDRAAATAYDDVQCFAERHPTSIGHVMRDRDTLPSIPASRPHERRRHICADYWIPLATLGIILIAAATTRGCVTYDNVGSQSHTHTDIHTDGLRSWPSPRNRLRLYPHRQGVVDTGDDQRARLVWNARDGLWRSHDG